MKWKRYLVNAYILRIFKIKVCRFSINFKVKFLCNIQKQNFTHNKQRMFLSITMLFYDIMPLFITWLRYIVDIIAPSWIPPEFLSIDKKFILIIMNFKWTLYMSSINKAQNRWDLSLKNIVFTFIMLRGTQPEPKRQPKINQVWGKVKA